jgi:hypothetical protein
VLTLRAERPRLAQQHPGDQLPELPLDPQVGLERMIGFGAGHRREDVDLVHVRAAQGAERGGGPDAAVHVTTAVDARRLVPARDRAGGDHGIGKRRAPNVRVAEQHPPPGVIVHGRDPGLAVNPVRRGRGADGLLKMLVVTPVQRADQ